VKARRRAAVASLAAVAATAAALVILPQTGRHAESGALAFQDAHQQQRFAQEHVQTELASFLVARDTPPDSFASRPLL
jgi:hypothetical protein